MEQRRKQTSLQLYRALGSAPEMTPPSAVMWHTNVTLSICRLSAICGPGAVNKAGAQECQGGALIVESIRVVFSFNKRYDGCVERLSALPQTEFWFVSCFSQ